MTYYSKEHETIICRLIHLVSRLITQPEIILKIVSSKVMLVRMFLYFNRQFKSLRPYVLKVLYSLFKLKDKLNDYISEYDINTKTFVQEAKAMLVESMETWNREDFINLSGLVSSSLDCFPESATEYSDLVAGLTDILKDRLELERKNAAVLVAKLARNEEVKKVMVKHHTMEVLMSLGNNVL